MMLRLFVPTLITALLAPPFALAKDVNVCILLGETLSRTQNEFDQAKIAVANSQYVCQGTPHEATCPAELRARLEKASLHLASIQKSYREAGCEDDSSVR